VSAIALLPDGVRVQAGDAEYDADQVVVAVPPALAVEQIAFTPGLPAAFREAAEATAVGMATTVKAVAVYEEPFWRGAALAGSAISYAGPFREFDDHSGPGGTPAALFGPAAAGPHAVHALDWSRERYTMPRAPRWSHLASGFGSPVFQQPMEGRVHFASAETATAYAGHIEEAIRAGLDTAARVLESG